MSTVSNKEEARRVLDQLPETATWKEIIYSFYVHEQIEAGLRDCEAGRTKSMEDVFAQFGITDED